jgi:hypothetical protein
MFGVACSSNETTTVDEAAVEAAVDSPASVATSATTTPATTPATTPITTPSTTPSTAVATTVVAGSGDEFCDQLLIAASAFDTIGMEDVETSSPDEVEADLAASLAVLETLVGSAPADLVDPLERLRLGLDTIREFYAAYDYDLAALSAAMAGDPALVDEYVERLAAISPDFEIDEGMERLTAYQRDVCGHDVEA